MYTTRLLALVLVVSVPAFAQQQVNLTPPSTDSATPAAAQVDKKVDLMPAIVGGAIALAAVAVVVTLAIGLSQSNVSGRQVMRTDFPCNQGGQSCDAYVNPPAAR